MPSRRERASRLPPLKLGESPQPPAEDSTPPAAHAESTDESAPADPTADSASDGAGESGDGQAEPPANRAARRGMPPDNANGLQRHLGKQSSRQAVSRQAFRHRSR